MTKKMKIQQGTLRVCCGVVGLVALLTAQAGTATYDFDSQPPPDLNFVGNAEWRSDGGVNNSGYMALFDSVDSQHASVLLPDFDQGLIVKAFTFECDLRVGNPTGEGGRPADGFSISYARASDPVVADLSQEPPVDNLNNFALGGAPENGTLTGLAISFDTWSGNALPDGPDLEGIILRVDNRTLLVNGQRGIAMATRNGECDDPTSLQTGPWTGGEEGSGPSDVSGLCWARLRVEMDENGAVTVTWKGAVIADHIQTGFTPSAGRIVFAGRTGGANENTHIDNVTVTTVPADTFIISQVTGSAYGFQFTVSDSGPSVLDPATLVVKYDGVNVTPQLYKPAGGNVTTATFTDLSKLLPVGQSHTVEITAKDTRGVSASKTSTYTIPSYLLVPAAYKLATAPTVRGMKERTHMIDEAMVNGFTGRFPTDENLTANAEQQLADGYTDPDTGQPYPNSADPVTSDITVVNWDQSGGDIDANNPDNFNSVEPVNEPVPNDAIPGIIPGDVDNIVGEVIAYVELKKGLYRMGVNSDDGFKLSVAPGQPSVTGVVLGEFNGGRGAADSVFDFAVEADGYYPMRLLWWEGVGGANCEWFSVDLVTGEKLLVNGTAPNAIKTYRTGAGRAVLKSVLPAANSVGGLRSPGVKAVLVDGATTVVDGSIKVIVNGKDVTAESQIVNGTTTTASYKPTGPVDWGQTPSWRLIWTESTTPPTTHTNDFTFRLGPDELPAEGAFWIEAEDWDYDNGKTLDVASVMPYAGGAYDGLAGVLSVDYWDNQNEADGSGVNFTYRTDQRPNHADVTDNTGGRFGADRPGSFDLSTNYRIGWVGDFWGNYTRTIPPGVYTAYAALSIDNSNVDGTYANLDKVTAGVGTTDQTLERQGTFYGRGNGTWGSNELAPLRGADGKQAYFKVGGGATTLRVTAVSGDFDWFVLLPSATVPPQLKSIEPDGLLFAVDRDASITWTFEDFSTSFNAASAKLTINGTQAPAADLTVSKNGIITTVTYDPPGWYEIGKANNYELTFLDSAGKTVSQSGSFVAHYMPDSPASLFVIEGEDFNTDSGKVQAAANVMPYLGGAYRDLSATANIDYARDDNEGSNAGIYRSADLAPPVPLSEQMDENGTVRARDAAGNPTWTLTANYRLGWAGGGRWQNYTRQVPAGDYQIWASMSYGETPGSAIRVIGNLRKVTSDPTQGSQTTEPMGYFRGSATGGWGANELVPLRATTAATGDAAVLTLGGATTFQFEYASADMDYFILVPVGGEPQPRFTKITLNANGSITVEWTGGGTLQAAPTVTGPWQDVPGAATPYTFTPTESMLFGRIKR